MAAKPYEPMIDVARTSEMMGISPQAVRALVRSRQLTAVTFSGSGDNPVYRFRPTDVDRAIRRIRNQKGFSPVYAMTNWEPPPPRPRPDVLSPRGRPRIVIDLARAEAQLKAGVGLVEVAREFGVSTTTVTNALRERRSEILRGPGRPSIEFDLEKAVAMRREGLTLAQIAAELGSGVSTGTIGKAVREAAPEFSRPPGFRDNDTVARMVTMRRNGATYKEIGAAYGMEAQTVANGFKSMGIRSPRVNRGVPRKEFDVARAIEMRRAGLSYAQIGKELGGLTSMTVSRRIREKSGLKGSLFNFDIKLALKMRREGFGYVAISKAVGASRPTVMNAIKIKMLSAPARHFQPGFDVGKAREMRRARKSYRAIAEELGVCTATVAKHLKRRGDDVNAKYGPRFDLKLATQLRREGKSFREIAQECGVSPGTIARHLNPHNKPAGDAEAPSHDSPSGE